MMKRLPILSTLAALLGVVVAAELSASAQIRVVTANPPEAGVHELAERFERERSGTGEQIEADCTASGPPEDVKEILADIILHRTREGSSVIIDCATAHVSTNHA